MAKVKTTCEVVTYEDGGDWRRGVPIKVISHSLREEFVEIEIKGQKVLVLGSDLIRAINNCMNSGTGR